MSKLKFNMHEKEVMSYDYNEKFHAYCNRVISIIKIIRC